MDVRAPGPLSQAKPCGRNTAPCPWKKKRKKKEPDLHETARLSQQAVLSGLSIGTNINVQRCACVMFSDRKKG